MTKDFLTLARDFFDWRTSFRLHIVFGGYANTTDITQDYGAKVWPAQMAAMEAQFRLSRPSVDWRPSIQLSRLKRAMWEELLWTSAGVAGQMAKVDELLRQSSTPNAPAGKTELGAALLEIREAQRGQTTDDYVPNDHASLLVSRGNVAIHRARSAKKNKRKRAHFERSDALLRRGLAYLDVAAALEIIEEGIRPGTLKQPQRWAPTPAEWIDFACAVAALISATRIWANLYFVAFELDELEWDMRRCKGQVKAWPRAKSVARVMARDRELLTAVAVVAELTRDPRIPAYVADALAFADNDDRSILATAAELLVQAIRLDGSPDLPSDIFEWHAWWMHFPLSHSPYLRGLCDLANSLLSAERRIG